MSLTKLFFAFVACFLLFVFVSSPAFADDPTALGNPADGYVSQSSDDALVGPSAYRRTYDNFNRADSSILGTVSTGENWGYVAGRYGIVSNQAKHTTTCQTGFYDAALINQGKSNGILRITLPVNKVNSIVFFRYINTANFNSIYKTTSNKYLLYRRVNNVNSYTFTDITAQNNDHISVYMSGHDIYLYVNDVLILSAPNIDYNNNTGALHGFGADCAADMNLTYDDFSFGDSKIVPNSVTATKLSCPSGNQGSNKITWNMSSDSTDPVSFYKIDRTTNGSSWATVGYTANGSTLEYTDTTSASNIWYAYRVAAAGGTDNPGYSLPTNSNWLQSPYCLPATPSNVTSSANACSGPAASNQIAFTQPNPTNQPVAYFNIQRTENGTDWVDVLWPNANGGGPYSFTDTYAVSAKWYAYRVRGAGASNNPGYSPFANSNWIHTNTCP